MAPTARVLASSTWQKPKDRGRRASDRRRIARTDHWEIGSSTSAGGYVPKCSIVSFLFERGCLHHVFKRSGFPGADDEFAEVEALFGDALGGPGADVVLDMSCGTGSSRGAWPRPSTRTRASSPRTTPRACSWKPKGGWTRPT